MKPMTVHVKQGNIDQALSPSRVVFYEQMQLVETFDDQSQCYMLFFYKQKYLTSVRMKRVKLNTYVARAFKKGTVYEDPSPHLQALIEWNAPLQKISYPQLKKQIARLYTRQEQAKILTFFESFIPKKQLFQDIKSFYYEYRREGNMSGAYRVIRIMAEFAPNHRFVKETANDLIYRDLADLYLEKSPELSKRDPLFKETNASFESHQQLLLEESRWIEASAHLLSSFYQHPTPESYQSCLNSFQQHFDQESRICLLEQITRFLPAFHPAGEDLFQHYLDNENIDQAALLYTEKELQLSENQRNLMKDLLNQYFLERPSEQLLPFLERYMNEQPDDAGELLDRYILKLLETMELDQVHQALIVFPNKSSTMRKVERMNEIQEDLDCMQELGELYYGLNQLEKSIECFQMEMELKPEAPEPLRWLAKVYADKQMMEESRAYQQLCVNVQKWA